MKSDTVEFWNDIWSTMDHTFADHDELLVQHAGDLKPGRALELGCGSGGNAIWLAQRGWQVTAVDFSEIAIEKAGKRADDQQVEVEFLVSDAVGYFPVGSYDLVISFYIQLWPQQRAQMLSNVAKSLAPGGRLLFVSHDRSAPPEGWSVEDLASLTSPEEVVAELCGLRIDRAEVVMEAGGHGAWERESDGPEEQDEIESARHTNHSGEECAQPEGGHWATTVVLAIRDS